MGCTFSGFNAMYDAANGGGDVWINDIRFKIVRQLGEGGFAYVYLVKEVTSDSSSISAGGLAKKVKDPSHLSDDGTYAMKKVLIQNNEQLELVREEIRLVTVIFFPFLIMLSFLLSLHKKDHGIMKHICYFLFIWMEHYWTIPML